MKEAMVGSIVTASDRGIPLNTYLVLVLDVNASFTFVSGLNDNLGGFRPDIFCYYTINSEHT
jgi:hypothetical protein